MKNLLRLTASAALAVTFVASAQLASAREHISIVGSSTVYPFATVVAERLGRSSSLPTPTVEATGTGGGMKLFCNGVGTNTADVANASRRMKSSEFETCQANGVKDIIEIHIGYDGIVLANSVANELQDFSRKDIFLALAKQVPNPDGSATLVDNPYKTWRDVNPDLPDQEIEVIGPPPTSGTRDAFVELAMEGGCSAFDFIKAMKDSDENQFKSVCHNIREDGAFVEAGENDNLIVQKLERSPKAYGIFGYSFLDQNIDKVQGNLVEGFEPDFDTIASGEYSISRPMYVYVKKAHIGVIPGIQQFINEFTSERAWGDDGYLSEKGMIPLAADIRDQLGRSVRNLEVMTGEGL